MALIIFRTVLIYFLIILAMRLMEKKQLGELQPSELVSTILISNLASISIESPELPLLGSIVPVFLIVVMEIFLSALCVHSQRAARYISGSPRIIIANGKIDQRTLFDLRFTMDDLLEALRGKEIFELADVEFAIVETNGSISVKKKFDADTPCNKDLSITPENATQPSLPLVIDGVLCPENLRQYRLTAEFVASVCKAEKCTQQDVLVLLCNDAKETTLIKKESRQKPA